MNSFFVASTIGFRRQSPCSIAWWNFKTARRMSRSAEAHANAVAKESTGQPTRRITFDDLGLHPPILMALRAAFPNVQYPTAAQEEFIPAILSGKDVLLKDATGSGK
jgi:superfamily II DNA/RNA helicase